MSDHLPTETLSAYIDGEVDAGEREVVEAHFGQCSQCRDDLELLRSAASAVARLDDVALTPDEHRLLRQAVLAARPGIKRWAPIWGLAGVTALVVAGVFGFMSFQQQSNRPTFDTTARRQLSGPAQDTQVFDFQSDEQIRQVVASQSQVAQGIEKFTVADIGTQQEPAIQLALVVSLSRSVSASKAQQDGVSEQDGASEGLVGRAMLTSGAFNSKAGEICIRKVLRSQPYPMIPLLARQAAYKQKPAWLLVYAFTPDQTGASRLDRAQIWLISPEECARLEGPALINAAYHYSFYKKS